MSIFFRISKLSLDGNRKFKSTGERKNPEVCGNASYKLIEYEFVIIIYGTETVICVYASIYVFKSR